MGMNNEDTIENNNNIDRSNLKLITELDREIEENKLTLPKNHKAELLIWKDVTISDLKRLDEETLPERIKYELGKILTISDYEGDKRDAILLDYYFYLLQFARDKQFTAEKTSTLLSIANRVHKMCAETPFDNITNCYQYFRDLLVTHSVRRPPFSIDIFSVRDIKDISEYMVNTYFRHYKLYKYVFTPLVRLDLTIMYNGEPVSPPPPSERDEASPLMDDTREVSAVVTPVIQDTPAEHELRELIRVHLGAEIAQLRKGIEDELGKVQEIVSRKLAVVEPQVSQSATKKKGKK